MNTKSEKIYQYSKLLYRKVGKMNLYVCFCCKEKEPDNIRLQEEIEQIKQIISDIETQITL